MNRDDFSEVYLFFDYDGHQDNLSDEEGTNSFHPLFKDYDITVWKNLIEVFAMRISCLMNSKTTVAYEQYVESVSPFEIYKMQEQEIEKQRVFVLSAFPEFLVDYYGVRLWRTCVKTSF